MSGQYINYFAYGSNLSTLRLANRISSARVFAANCFLYEHDLKFHKVGKDGSSKADAFFTGNDKDFVIGVVYSISKKEEEILDRYEGLGSGYEKKSVRVIDRTGQKHECFTYYATQVDSSFLPYEWYLEHVLQGAREHKFNPEYLDRLASISTRTDPDEERRLKELSIYPEEI